MRSTNIIFLSPLLLAASSICAHQLPPPPASYSAFQTAIDSQFSYITSEPDSNAAGSLNGTASSEENEEQLTNLELLKRQQGSCAVGFNSCSILNAVDANSCCATTAICTYDNANNVACCPIGAVCTGTIAPVTQITTTGSTVAVIAPATTTGAFSAVANAYFPFPYIPSPVPATPTAYNNPTVCASYLSVCQSNFAECTADLQGNGAYGVTVVAPGGGLTVVGATTTGLALGSASASAVCNSLSSVACWNLQASNCGTATAATGFIVPGNGAERLGFRSRSWLWSVGLTIGVMGGWIL